MPFAMIPILWVQRIVIVTFLPSVSPVLPVVASPGAGGRMRRIFAVERLGLLHVDLVLEMNLELVNLLLQPLGEGSVLLGSGERPGGNLGGLGSIADLLKISSSLGSVVS